MFSEFDTPDFDTFLTPDLFCFFLFLTLPARPLCIMGYIQANQQN